MTTTDNATLAAHFKAYDLQELGRLTRKRKLTKAEARDARRRVRLSVDDPQEAAKFEARIAAKVAGEKPSRRYAITEDGNVIDRIPARAKTVAVLKIAGREGRVIGYGIRPDTARRGALQYCRATADQIVTEEFVPVLDEATFRAVAKERGLA